MTGTVLGAAGTVELVSRETPLEMWPAGDTGHTRAALLRAHPVLADGALRVERLGQRAAGVSIEVQRWRRAGPLGVAAAAFTDVLHTGRRLRGDSITDADVGVGFRISLPSGAGILRADTAHGLRDGADAVSVTWSPGR
jgi:hypothetical protein